MDFKKENEYAGETIRILGILRARLSEDEATRLVFKLEEMARKNDQVVQKIIEDPRIISRYDVAAYDGLELRIKPPAIFPVHFMKTGLRKIKLLDKHRIFAHMFFNRDGRYAGDKMLEWVKEEFVFNELRLEELNRRGTIMITDPAKVRIVFPEKR